MSNQVITFGCRLNAYESEVIKQKATDAGMTDAIIINTCAVTAEAERQARQTIRKLKRENPNARIIVTGCSAQLRPEQYAKMDEVERVIGNHEKMQANSFVPEAEEKVIVNDIMSIKETAGHMITGLDGRVRAFIQIQNGCNHRCTFCTIPYARGNSRSVPLGEIIEQVKLLVENGTKEVVLTGVDITSYGEDLPGTPNFTQMIKRILIHVPGLERLRISSIDSVEIGQEFYDLLKTEPRIMPHFHLSLQAGDDLVLKRMKRRHLRNDTIQFCKRVKEARPDALFGADIIAGFPTETEEMFQNTFNLVEECDLTFLHVFPYSARPGTPAAKMPQVEKALIKERAARLREKGQEMLERKLSSYVGKKVRFLMETETQGHTDNFLSVETVTSHTPGSVLEGTVTSVKDGVLIIKG